MPAATHTSATTPHVVRLPGRQPSLPAEVAAACACVPRSASPAGACPASCDPVGCGAPAPACAGGGFAPASGSGVGLGDSLSDIWSGVTRSQLRLRLRDDRVRPRAPVPALRRCGRIAEDARAAGRRPALWGLATSSARAAPLPSRAGTLQGNVHVPAGRCERHSRRPPRRCAGPARCERVARCRRVVRCRLALSERRAPARRAHQRPYQRLRPPSA